ncbi:MAG: AAA family ATPase, partial [Amylibacter sp.]
MIYSDDQAAAFDAASEALMSAGIDLKNENLLPQSENKNKILAILGKAGSGKTLLLAELAEALSNAGVELISGDYEGKPRKDRRTLAILAPTNKAASVLRNRGVQATTIHRILYTPMYDP